MRDALEEETGQHAATSSNLVDEAPCEDHGEDEFDHPVSAGCDE